MGLNFKKVSSSPPMMRNNLPSRAWLILEAIAASRVQAPTALAAESISFCILSETVAQLMKTLPSAPMRRLFCSSMKMFLIALSLLTTVNITSASDVSSAKLSQFLASSSSANFWAAWESRSLTAVIW